MKRNKSSVTIVTIVLIGSLLVSLLWPSGSNVVHAESITLKYDTDSFWTGYSYSKFPTLTPTNIITKDDYKIKSLKVVNYSTNEVVKTIDTATGKTSYSLGTAEPVNGIQLKVRSSGNTTTRGYYAWYRYPKSSGDTYWYANFNRVDDSYNEFGDSRTSKSEELDETGMPAHPGTIDSTLALTGNRDKAFYTNSGQWVDTPYICHEDLTGIATVNGQDTIDGPAGEGLSGYASASKISNYTVDAFPDLNRIIVRYKQKFDYVSDASKPLEAYGAALMVYFSAFTVDLVSNTYHYPYELQVEWEPLTSPSPSGGASPTPTATPTPKPTGDFDILPATISFRDPFSLKPKNFNMPAGCTYQSHVFRLSSGTAWTSAKQASSSASLDFSYPGSYPAPITVGTVIVSMQITASCGTSDWVSHTLTVNGPTQNNPPYFKLGWFKDGDFSSNIPVTQVVQGKKLLVRSINDPASTPPSPSDPDGDDIHVSGWDFGNGGSWVQSLPAKYSFHPLSNYLPGIIMDTLGYHTVYMTMTDEFGKSYTAGAMVEVIPPNPVPVCSLEPPYIKSGRPYPDTGFISNNSYSPVGRQITEYTWGNKKAAYINSTDAPANETITLSVKDSSGLESLAPAACQLRVEPDQPPVAKLDVPPLGIRTQAIDLFNKSTSPDGDGIQSVEYKYKYDANNNGFADDLWQSLPGSLIKATFTPNRVGRYLFYIKATESYGAWGDTSSTPEVQLTLNVMNLAPSVSFQVEGKNEVPVLNPPVNYPVDTILSQWSLTKVNSNSAVLSTNWYNSGGTLYAGLGRGYERQYAWGYSTESETVRSLIRHNDNGFGTNRLTAYRGMKSADTAKSQPLLLPDDGSLSTTYGIVPNLSERPRLRSNKTHFFFLNSSKFYAMNKSKIGRYTYESIYSGSVRTGIRHKWVDGNPYDYILGNGTITTSRTFTKYDFADHQALRDRDLTRAQVISTGIQPTDPEVMGYEVSDRTVYQAILWNCMSARVWGSDYPEKVYEIRSYDIFTGQYLGSSFDYGGEIVVSYDDSYIYNTPILLNYHDDLLFGLSTTYFHNRPIPSRMYKFGRSSMKSASTITQPAGYLKPGDAYCYPANSEWYKGVVGDLYRYQQMHCSKLDSDYLDYTEAVYLEKFDSTTMSVAWKTKLSGTGFRLAELARFPSSTDYEMMKETILVNPIVGEIVTRTYYGTGRHYNVVDMDSGSVEQSYANLFPSSNGKNLDLSLTGSWFYVNWQGQYLQEALRYNNGEQITSSVTSDGLITFHQPQWEDYGPTLTRSSRWAGDNYGSWAGQGGILTANSCCAQVATDYLYGEYFGDGLYVGVYNTMSSGYKQYDYAVWLHPGTPSDLPKQVDGFELGQLQSNVALEGEAEISFQLRMDKPQADQELAGMSFRMQDAANRYAVETDGQILYLSKYIGGTRTVLHQSPYPFQEGTTYSLRITGAGTQIDVSLNGVPYLSANDGQYGSGKFGPFSSKSYVAFSGITSKLVPLPSTAWMQGYALWEIGSGRADIRYIGTSFSDPENDPMAGSLEWSFSHTVKFLNNGGLSALHGQTRVAEQTDFDRVGEYTIALKARDDPHPEYRSPSPVFDSYRKSANPFYVKLTVHRRPIAQFTVTPQADGKVSWTDSSYDPDRFNPDKWGTDPAQWIELRCSPTDTSGMDYCATRGIVEREYSYLDPNGQLVMGKLVTPQASGTYTVYLRVKDEYGAWSYPAQQTVTIGTCCAPMNHKPTVALEYPIGTKDNPNLENSTTPLIRWRQYDEDPGTVFQSFHVRITDESGAPVAGTNGDAAQYTASTWGSWQVNRELVPGRKYQVQVQVGDGLVPSDWSTIGWMVINSKPVVKITDPTGSVDSPTVIGSDPKPVISWHQFDAEWNQFNKFYLEILREDGSAVWSTGWSAYQNTSSQWNGYSIPVDLPTGEKLQVRIMVTDHNDAMWSDWSNTVWFKINDPPWADLSSPKGTYGSPALTGLTPRLEWHQGDPDPNPLFTAYQIRIRREDGSELWKSEVLFQNTLATANSHTLTDPLPPGLKLQVDVRVWDQDGAESPWSGVQWILTNRPPASDFDWTPKPVWEGDTVRLFSLSSDPDGNPLAYDWTVVTPAGETQRSSGPEWSGRFELPGAYTVRLEVSDGMVSDAVTKRVQAEPLTIRAEVHHTPDWLEHHRESGHATATDPKDFYSGEKLLLRMLRADAPVQEAWAWLEGETLEGGTLRIEARLDPDAEGDATLLTGELYDERLGSLTGRLMNGEKTVHFRLLYANGVEKLADVPIRIIGSVHQPVQVHRIQ